MKAGSTNVFWLAHSLLAHAGSAQLLLVVFLNWPLAEASRPHEAQDLPRVNFQLPSGLSPQLLGELLAVDIPDEPARREQHRSASPHWEHRSNSLLATRPGRSRAEEPLQDLRASSRRGIHSHSLLDREQQETTQLCCCDWKSSECDSGSLEQPFFDIYGNTRAMCCRSEGSDCQGGGTKAQSLFCEKKLLSLTAMVAENAALKKENSHLQAMLQEHEAALEGHERENEERKRRRVEEAASGLESSGESDENLNPFDTVRHMLREVGKDFWVHTEKIETLDGALEEVERYMESQLSATAEHVLAEAKVVHRQNALEHLRALATEQSLITNSTEQVSTHEQNIKTFEAALKEDLRREERLDQAQAKYQELVPLLPGEEELLMNSSKLARGVEVDNYERDVGTPPSAMQSIITNAIKVHRHHAAQHKTSLAQEERLRTDASANLNLHVKAAETLRGFIEKDAERAKVLLKATSLLNQVKRLAAGEENEDERTSLSNSMEASAQARTMHELDRHPQIPIRKAPTE